MKLRLLLSILLCCAGLAVPAAVSGSEPKLQPFYVMNEAYRLVPLTDKVPEKAILLTFDDGPSDKLIVHSLLNTLENHRAKAIFFVNGYRVEQNPELVKLIHTRGHAIGNHTWDHLNLTNENKAAIEQQICSLQSKLNSLIGQSPVFFRPPYGAGNELVRLIAKNHAMLYMTWSNGSLDWEMEAKGRPEIVIRNIMKQLQPGDNILMHEVPWTAEALDSLLTRLHEEGYSFIDPARISLTR